MKDKTTCLILCGLGIIGLGGLHDFYLKNIGKGLIKLFTYNFFFIGTIVDFYRIYKDKYSFKIRNIRKNYNELVSLPVEKSNVENNNKPVLDNIEIIKTTCTKEDITDGVLKGHAPTEFVVFDLETTGLYPTSDEIVEFCILDCYNNDIKSVFTHLVKPTKKMSDRVIKIHNISNEMLENKEKIEIYIHEIYNILKNRIIIGHNVKFDIDFISALFQKYKFDEDHITFKYIDTCRLARQIIDYSEVSNYKLQTLKEYLNIENVAHRALGDCETTLELYKYLISTIKSKENA